MIVLVAAMVLFGCGGLYGQVDGGAHLNHYWEGVDYSKFKDLDMDAEQEVRSGNGLETRLAGYFWMLRLAPDSVASVSVRKLLDSVAVNCGSGEYPNGYDKLLEAAERYFYTPDSPYFNEERLLLFLNHKIGRTDIAEVDKSREKYLASMISRNMVGTQAVEFEYADADVLVSLYYMLETLKFYNENYSHPGSPFDYKMMMVVFFSADCKKCRDGIKKLLQSDVVKELIPFKLRIDLVCVEGYSHNIRSDFKTKDFGDIVMKDVSNILENNLYSIRHTPSVYIFDLDGIVLLKDASVESAIDYLLAR